ncbi:MAG: PAS domain-containing protein, partial [Syntrophorhabdaceae bacterium]|nr:PAS domain-containing protein [Syntrophorhabdaceae bacterium]
MPKIEKKTKKIKSLIKTERKPVLKYPEINEEEKYKIIFEQAVEGIFQSTPDGQYINVNPAYALMLGYSSPEEFLSSIKDIRTQIYWDPKDRDLFIKNIETHGEVRNFEVRQRKRDGSWIWVSVNAKAIKDNAGKTLYYL